MFMSRFVPRLAVLLLVPAGAWPEPHSASGANQARVEVTVLGRSSTPVTAEYLATFARHTVKADEHGAEVTYEGVLVHDILEKAGAPLGEELRGKALADFVLITARDGYAVVYALTEFEPAFTDSDIILADKSNGHALGDKQGPFKVVVPHDKKPSRSVRMVRDIQVLPGR
jgi:Oxidoreductase molybdopterin binding domain